jgi:hypothetical protein
MHPISPATLSLLQNKKGLEPLVLLEIFWHVDSPNSTMYCDKSVEGIEGRILSLGELESVLDIQKNSTSATLSVTLTDTDGTIKEIFNQCDIHKRRVKVYQWFGGLPLSEKILLFIGYISSPLVWSERERTLSFDVVTKVEDQEIGFSVEEGQYKNIPDSLIGKPWPLGFGKCVKVPALALNNIPSNVTAAIDAEYGVEDPSLAPQIGLTLGNQGATEELAMYWVIAAGYAAFIRDFHSVSDEEESQWNSLYEQFTNQANQYFQQAANVGLTASALSSMRGQQRAKMNPSINIQTRGDFPQGVSVPVQLRGTNAQGFFNGSTFYFTYVEHPGAPGVNMLVEQPIPSVAIDVNSVQRERITKLGFHHIEAGTEFVWRSTSKIQYVINLLDCEIRACYAVRNGKLRRIPKDYIIDKSYKDFGAIKAKVITVGKRMPDGKVVALPNTDEGWEGDVYVTFIEDEVGNNTADQIQYLIETYTDLTCDPATFSYVRTKLLKYPSNFAFLDRPQVLDAVKDMAWQARCALWVVGETVYIKYLPEEVASVATLDEGSIEEGSFELTTTETEELVTKLVATWRPNYYRPDPNKLILRYNTKKYGSQEQEYDFYIYNDKKYVLKAATFWIIRYANTWKKIRCKTFMENIKLESFDTVLVDLVGKQAADASFKALVETCTYDPSDNTVFLELWTPILLGTMAPFVFAWPANITIQVIDSNIPDPGISTPNDGAVTDLTPLPGEEMPAPTGLSTSDVGGSGPDFKNTNDRADPDPVADEQALDEGAGIPSDQQAGPDSGAPPNFQYEYKDYDPDQRSPFTGYLRSVTAPGMITGGSGKTYTADFYPDGLNAAKIQIENVKQLQIDGSEQIPVGTWCLISRVVRGASMNSGEDTFTGEVEYYIQVPVWM